MDIRYKKMNVLRFDTISLFPQMFEAITNFGITSKALYKMSEPLWQWQNWNPRDYANNRLGYIDDRPYGGGCGMIMQAEPIEKSILAAKQNHINSNFAGSLVIYLSPQGEVLNQNNIANLLNLVLTKNLGLILLCGRYEGIDERVLNLYVEKEISIGDYVLSGGELAAMILMDAMIRLLPKALNHQDSAVLDSFSEELDGGLDFPQYTRPEVFHGERVPEVLLSGNHQAILQWRLQQSRLRTQQKRPDLFLKMQTSSKNSKNKN